jgi:IS5 family transposase
MAYKYFLDLDPEDGLIDSSLLTKFRKTRITDDILEEMLKETISQAIKKGLIKSTAIIVDSTHTNAAVRPKTVTQVLRDLSKQLRKEIYKNMYDLSAKFPEKPNEEADLNEEIVYTQQLLVNIEKEIQTSEIPKIKKLYERIKELLETDRIREIRSKDDEDARFGHKTVTSTFFGYKNHLAMTEERIITGIEVTGGGSGDGKQLESLVEKSRANGIEVKEVIGDTAFSSIHMKFDSFVRQNLFFAFYLYANFTALVCGLIHDSDFFLRVDIYAVAYMKWFTAVLSQSWA